MRTYGKRFMRNLRARETRNSRETKNAIIWSIDEDNRKANVRIHGSNTTISAYFPVSWYTMPDWVKLGAPARILFSGGHRGRIELLGPGVYIPYPQTGQVWPDPPVRPNQILSGLKILPIPNEKRGAVIVTTGRALITNEEIEVEPITFDGTYNFSDGGFFGQVAAVININGPGQGFPAHSYNITRITVDANGDINSYTGDAFAATTIGDYVDIYDYITEERYLSSDPPSDWSEDILPAISQEEFELGRVVMFDNVGIINSTNLNFVWRKVPYHVYSREPTSLINETLDCSLDWEEEHINIQIEAYNNLGIWWNLGEIYAIKAEIVNGTGAITDGLHPGVYGTTCICYNLFDFLSGISYPIWYIRYKRDNLVTDISPTIHYRLIIENEVYGECSVELYDESGLPMH